MLVMRGKIEPESENVMTPENENLIVGEYERVFTQYKRKKNYKEYMKNK